MKKISRQNFIKKGTIASLETSDLPIPLVAENKVRKTVGTGIIDTIGHGTSYGCTFFGIENTEIVTK